MCSSDLYLTDLMEIISISHITTFQIATVLGTNSKFPFRAVPWLRS
jgi:hypothetical protein